ncbi:T9SS type A sorting domain-containing protein [bacterium]|nr:T9SS type A sorting domain-containing protein [bacterium]
MKMRILSVLVLILALTVGAQAYERTVLVEYFSNTACGPCGTYYYEVDNFLAQYTREEAAFMVYHVNWPSAGDWYYVANPNENMARRSYYGLNSVPWFAADGTYTTQGQYTFSYLFSTIAARVGQYTPVEIVFDGGYYNFQGELTADITINSDVALDGCRLQVALIDLTCPYGTASNGIDYVYNMLDMNPSSSGTDLSSIGAGGSESFSFQFETWADHEPDNYGFVFFVQDNATKEVHQALQVEGVDILFPLLTMVNYEFDDADQAMPNGRPDPGETVDVLVTVENNEAFLSTANLTATLTCDNDDIIISHDQSTYPDIFPGTMMSNAADPFVIEVPEMFETQYVLFNARFTDGSGYEADFEFLQLVGQPEVALIDDSPADEDLYQVYFDLMLESGVVMDVLTGTEAVTTDISSYDVLVWNTSNATDDVLNALEINAISTFLDAGGKVLLSGENIGEFAGTEDLLADYFMAEHELDFVGQSYVLLVGVAEGPFPNAELIISGGVNTTEEQSSVTPLAGAESLFAYYSAGNIAGVGYNGVSFSTIYLPFNLEAVSGVNDSWRAADVLWSCLHWMGATTSVEDAPAAEAALPQNVALSGYPNPFNAAMTVSYTLPTAAEVELSVINLLGQTVAELSSGQVAAGVHEVTWDASALSSGVYFLNLRAGDDMRMEKVMLLK